MSYNVKSVDAFSHQGFKALGVLNHYNEDRLVVGTNTFAAIDGATAVVDVDMGGLNPSAYMAKFLAEYLHSQDHDDACTALQLLERANAAIRKHLKAKWPNVYAMGKLGPSAAVALVKFHKNGTVSVASAADCAVVFRKNNRWQTITPTRRSLGTLGGTLKATVQKMVEAGMPLDAVRKSPEIKALLQKQRLQANVSFGTFNHEPEACQFFFGETFSAEGIDAIALFTDGMEWHGAATHADACETAANKMSKLGVANYHAALEKRLQADTSPRFKHMDDASGMVLRLK